MVLEGRDLCHHQPHTGEQIHRAVFVCVSALCVGVGMHACVCAHMCVLVYICVHWCVCVCVVLGTEPRALFRWLNTATAQTPICILLVGCK